MKRIILIIVLCVSLSLSSCSYSQTGYDTNYDSKKELVIPPEPDWDAIHDSLDELEAGLKDVLEQIGSQHTYRITYSIDLKYNNSVGDEWKYGVSYNNKYIASSSEILIADTPTEVNLVAFAIELDDYNDYGSTNVTFDALEVGQKQTKRVTVLVRENNGRYTGNTAKWQFDITIKRI